MAQAVKRLPAMQETWVWSLGWEDPLEKEIATHSSTLVWKIPWTEEPGKLQTMRSQRVGHDWATWLYGIWFGNIHKIKMHISLDPKIPLLEIYSTYIFPQIHSNISVEIYSVRFTASFFTIAESWKQPKRPQGVDYISGGVFISWNTVQMLKRTSFFVTIKDIEGYT